MNNTIYDIDFSYPHDDFMTGLRDFLDNHGNSNMNAVSSEVATKNGKYVYKIEITCKDDPNITSLLFEKNANNADILFLPSGFRSYNGTFYTVTGLSENVQGTDDDTFYAFTLFLESKAKEQKGDLVYKAGNKVVCISKGNTKSAKECIVDSNGNVYGAKEVKNVSLSDGSSASINFNTKIGEWNKERKAEDPNFASVLNDSKLSTIDKMHYIGKYVVELKANEEIEADEFKDIFIQAGLFTSGFSNDKVLNMIYKLLN